MTDPMTVLHNPRCSTSRAALAEVPTAHVVDYLRAPLDEAALRELLGKLLDPPSALVRRDPLFRDLGLTDTDVATADQVVTVLLAHPQLMQRPVLVRGDRAIIGRPRERVAAFIAEG